MVRPLCACAGVRVSRRRVQAGQVPVGGGGYIYTFINILKAFQVV